MSVAVAALAELHPGTHGSGSYDPKEGPIPTESQYAAFAQMHEYFNRRLFSGALPLVMLTFSRKPKARGFFSAERWQERADETHRVGEIALNPDCLRDIDGRTLASIVVHEQVHCWQHVAGVPGRRGYHNKEWGTKMQTIGLMPSNTGEPDGRRTGQRMTHYVIQGGPFDLAFAEMPHHIMLPFTSGAEVVRPKRSDPSKVKYTCSQCGIAAWGRVGLRIDCQDCGTQMTTAESVDAKPASTMDGNAAPADA